ncbi:MAG: hypothetical protein FLDDKLPJ_03070 [Phycisphaerae bacterium]|nr:hypothetical protein [Phycisphaerae bacterium]
MSPRARAYFELVRVPNLFTAPPDVIAGAAISGVFSGIESLEAALPLGITCAASMSLYAGGVALNDVVDAPHDAHERPERPIPSGRIARGAAAHVAVEHFAAGLLLAACVGFLAPDAGVRPGCVAVILTTSIVSYNVLKHTVFGPALMGLCRGINFLLGASLHPAFSIEALVLHDVAWPSAAACLAVYVAGLTAFARHETGRARRLALLPGWLGMLAGISLMPIVVEVSHSSIEITSGGLGLIVSVVLLMTAVVAVGVTAITRPGADVLKTAVGWLIALIVFIDAALASVGAGVAGWLATAGFLLPYVALKRRFAPT